MGTILLVMSMVWAGCNVQQEKDSPETRTIPVKPSENMLSEDQMSETINREIGIAFDLGNEFIIDEAAGVLSLLRQSVVSTVQKDYESAIEHLNKAIARTKLIKKGNTQNVIAQVSFEVIQNVDDAETAVRIISQIDSLMSAGEVQKARNQMALLSNEILVTRESIDIGEYLNVMERADALMKSKNYDEALMVMQEILGKSVREKRVVPLPLLRAHRMVIEAEDLINQAEPDSVRISQMLDAAGYEIAFSEILGYGKPDAGYQSIRKLLGSATEAIQNNQVGQAKKQMTNLKSELKNLKNKISQYKKLNV